MKKLLLLAVVSLAFPLASQAQFCVSKDGSLKAPSTGNKCPRGSKPYAITTSAGTTGPKGDKGEKGDKGDQGQKGDVGPQGLKGDTGAQGPQGLKGDIGETGPVGPSGAQGIQGPKGDAGNALSFSSDVLMTCKTSLFSNEISKGPRSSRDIYGRYSNQVLAHCGSNQFMLSHSTMLERESPDTELQTFLIMRDIVHLQVTNTSDFTGAANNSPAIPAGIAVNFFDTNTSNKLFTRLICCTLDANEPVGTPTVE